MITKTFDNSKAREMLTLAFFSTTEKSNLVIPQDMSFNDPQDDKNNSYIAFYIPRQERTLIPRQWQGENEITLITRIELSFFGKKAQEWAQSTLLWDLRSDLRELFDKYDVQLLNTRREITAIPYEFEGDNNQIVYCTSLSFISHFIMRMEEEEMKKWETLIMKGRVFEETE